jgi:hypothetical protein
VYPDELTEVPFAEVVRARHSSSLPTPRAGDHNLPLGELDPEVLERLAAQMIKLRANRGAHFYGRRGQKQHGFDIVERETDGTRSVYQVRRYAVLTPDEITSAVTEYAGPEPQTEGGQKSPRRFDAGRYVLFTSAEFEIETALQDRLEQLQANYAGDLVIEVWGREMISAMLRDSGALVNSVFGSEWARVFCGFAPPPADPADPNPLGLVDSPIQVLNLDAILSAAQAHEIDNPRESARLHGILADTLAEANFPDDAAAQRRHQAKLLQAGGDSAGAFAVLWELARADFTAGATSMLGPVQNSLEALRPVLDTVQAAKLDVLSAAYSWYEHGSQLAAAVPALEMIAAGDPDATFLVCTILEQTVTDGWFDFDPPWSLVTPGEVTSDLLTRLRQCATGLSSGDVVVRARQACALADASLTANSSAAESEAAFTPVLQRAGAGRYLHAGGLVFARAARAVAMHGDTARAIELWRQAILLSSESRLYGDVAGCRHALNASIFEQPIPAFGELAAANLLPNANRLLAPAQSAELDALQAAHASKLPDALSVARRFQWEARLSGHLTDEREALELVGDVFLAARRPDVAVITWVMAGAAKKAADLAQQLPSLAGVEPWARSPVRACQAAAAQVIGAQAPLYGKDRAAEPVQLLLGLTAGLWIRPRLAPHPELDAINALSRFGRDLPASAVDPVLGLIEPLQAAVRAVTPEIAVLLIQLYWAVPARRGDLAAVIGPQLALADPPPGLWEMIGNLPAEARDSVSATVSDLAEAGNNDALRTLAQWRQPTPAVQAAARRTCARLLRQPADEPSTTWSLTTRFSDAVALLIALAGADAPVGVDPHDLEPGAGPIVSEKVMFSMAVGPGRPEVTPQSVPQPDPQALIAAGPPSGLAAAVAEHLVGVAEGHHPPAFFRAEALAALYSLLGELAPDINSRLTARLLAIAIDPGLNEYDQAELNSQNPLSRGRLDLGARRLPALALVTAATAAALAAEAEPEPQSLPAGAARTLVTNAVQLLHSADPEASKLGAIVLAMASRIDRSLSRYADALIVHPSAEVRNVAAARAVLDEPAQRILAADSSPMVRATLAGRVRDLDAGIQAALRDDEHPEVRRALAVNLEPEDSESS